MVLLFLCVIAVSRTYRHLCLLTSARRRESSVTRHLPLLNTILPPLCSITDTDKRWYCNSGTNTTFCKQHFLGLPLANKVRFTVPRPWASTLDSSTILTSKYDTVLKAWKKLRSNVICAEAPESTCQAFELAALCEEPYVIKQIKLLEYEPASQCVAVVMVLVSVTMTALALVNLSLALSSR